MSGGLSRGQRAEHCIPLARRIGNGLTDVFCFVEILCGAGIFPIFAAFKSAPVKLAPATLASVKSSAASSLPRRFASVKSAPRNDENSIITRAMFAPLKEEPTRFVVLKAPRIKPMDWFFH